MCCPYKTTPLHIRSNFFFFFLQFTRKKKNKMTQLSSKQVVEKEATFGAHK
jgi:hypothetical protein